MYHFHLRRDELQSMLGGGIPEGALVLLEGEYGAGKSVFGQRLLYGLLENRHNATLVSTELTTPQLVDQMESLDYPIGGHLIDERLRFLPIYPLVGRPTRRVDLLDRLLRIPEIFEREITMLDSFSGLVRGWARTLPPEGRAETVTRRLQDTLGYFKRLNARRKTVILTLQPGELPEEDVAAYRAAADVYMTLRLDVRGNDVSRSLFVRRFERSHSAPKEMLAFRVEPKVGFIVEIKSVS